MKRKTAGMLKDNTGTPKVQTPAAATGRQPGKTVRDKTPAAATGRISDRTLRDQTPAASEGRLSGRTLRGRIRRGSITVEAAVVLPFTILIVLAMISLCFYVHNRAWFTAGAYEAALCGVMEDERQRGGAYEASYMRARELGNTGFYAAQDLSLQVSGGRTVRVTYNMDTPLAGGFGKLHLKVQGKAVKLEPADYVRTKKCARSR